MSFDPTYREEVPSREEIDQRPGRLVVEFGANWCGHCQQLNPTVEGILASADDVAHLRVAVGKGKRLGRSFQVKLWPTLVFLRDGEEIAKLVRPSPQELEQAFAHFIAD
ncbi:thioredoxin [Bremerella cremea]|uniref:Thioredoxin n=1 Tax=Bremerella cremea TaxID=1031537 RepID=A0A368KZ06_9BACT|nr:thioredoxin family protein [Bremerella cremea]RCS55999.1 thioredoxin [Bremerella cremea]